MSQYAVIGNPIIHSLSPSIHCTFAKQAKINSFNYQRILAPLNGFAQTAQNFFKRGGKGCNISAPFKQEAYLLADGCTERAKKIGVVNTLTKNTQGQLLGDNTDSIGFIQDLTQYTKIADLQILILGAGGAARAALFALMDIKPKAVTIFNRTLAKAQLLAHLYNKQGQISIYASNFSQTFEAFDLVINATSADLNQRPFILDPGWFAAHTFAYDMNYTKKQNADSFLAQAQLFTSQYADGLGMLIYQAAETFFLWTGHHPDTKLLLAALRTAAI